MDEELFTEKQQFRQWWLWLILVLTMGSCIWQLRTAFHSSNNMHFRDKLLAAFGLLVPGLLIILLMLSISLNTIVKKDGIYVKFWPVHRRFKRYPWADLEKVQIRKYKPLLEYGGWGIRGIGRNRALNVSGNTGIQLTFKNGNRLLIGTQKHNELETILQKIKHVPFEHTYII